MIPLRFRCLLQANFKYLTKSFSTLVRLLGSSPIIYKYTKKLKKGDVAKLKTKQEEQGIQMVKRRIPDPREDPKSGSLNGGSYKVPLVV